MIKLCYLEYETRLTLGDYREFEKRTGNSLGFYLGEAFNAFSLSEGKSLLARMQAIKSVVPFHIALDIFDCITIDDVTKQELEDAMWRVDWIPTERDGEASEPWTAVLIDYAIGEFTDSMKDLIVKKKSSATS